MNVIGGCMGKKVENSSSYGFECPDCRFQMRVCRTKGLGDIVIRIRVCDRCGKKMVTNEK